MPLYDFKCGECDHIQEHFLAAGSDKKMICPKCESEKYIKMPGTFKLNVEYSNVKELVQNKIDPSIKDTLARVGKEALDQDTKTLENIYGKDKVESTFYGNDD